MCPDVAAKVLREQTVADLASTKVLENKEGR